MLCNAGIALRSWESFLFLSIAPGVLLLGEAEEAFRPSKQCASSLADVSITGTTVAVCESLTADSACGSAGFKTGTSVVGEINFGNIGVFVGIPGGSISPAPVSWVAMSFVPPGTFGCTGRGTIVAIHIAKIGSSLVSPGSIFFVMSSCAGSTGLLLVFSC